MTRFQVLTVVAALAVSACGAPRRAVPASAGHFSLMLEHSSNGWNATCEVGCAWKAVSMKCAGCEVRLTSVGIGPAILPDDKQGSFAFTLADSSNGWSAKAVRGSRWLSLGFGCPQAVCRARIDETGVSGS